MSLGRAEVKVNSYSPFVCASLFSYNHRTLHPQQFGGWWVCNLVAIEPDQFLEKVYPMCFQQRTWASASLCLKVHCSIKAILQGAKVPHYNISFITFTRCSWALTPVIVFSTKIKLLLSWSLYCAEARYTENKQTIKTLNRQRRMPYAKNNSKRWESGKLATMDWVVRQGHSDIEVEVF